MRYARLLRALLSAAPQARRLPEAPRFAWPCCKQRPAKHGAAPQAPPTAGVAAASGGKRRGVAGARRRREAGRRQRGPACGGRRYFPGLRNTQAGAGDKTALCAPVPPAGGENATRLRWPLRVQSWRSILFFFKA
jgi:hypothetical protein